MPGVTFGLEITYKTGKKLSECVFNDHRSSSLPERRIKGRLWVIFRAFGASLWRPSAPTMAPINRLWGASALAGWAPRAPRDAPEHKLKKIKKKLCFLDSKMDAILIHFSSKSRSKRWQQNRRKKTMPNYIIF